MLSFYKAFLFFYIMIISRFCLTKGISKDRENLEMKIFLDIGPTKSAGSAGSDKM